MKIESSDPVLPKVAALCDILSRCCTYKSSFPRVTLTEPHAQYCSNAGRIRDEPVDLEAALDRHVLEVGVLRVVDRVAAAGVIQHLTALVPEGQVEVVDVVAAVAAQVVVADTAVEGVVPLVAPQPVVARPAEELIVAGVTLQVVVAAAAVDDVEALTALQVVVATATGDENRAAALGEGSHATADDPVVAGTTVEHHRGVDGGPDQVVAISAVHADQRSTEHRRLPVEEDLVVGAVALDQDPEDRGVDRGRPCGDNGVQVPVRDGERRHAIRVVGRGDHGVALREPDVTRDFNDDVAVGVDVMDRRRHVLQALERFDDRTNRRRLTLGSRTTLGGAAGETHRAHEVLLDLGEKHRTLLLDSRLRYYRSTTLIFPIGRSATQRGAFLKRKYHII